MLISQNTTLDTFDSVPIDWPWNLDEVVESDEIMIKGHFGSGSGGYADHLFQYAAKELYGIENAELNYKSLR